VVTADVWTSLLVEEMVFGGCEGETLSSEAKARSRLNNLGRQSTREGELSKRDVDVSQMGM
jgi:hypothetical protein